MFVNTLVMRNRVQGSDSFMTLFDRVKHNSLEAYAHQQYPFERLVEALVKERDLGRSPLFQVMLVVQNNREVHDFSWGDLQVEAEEVAHTVAKFDLTFFITEASDGLRVGIEYCTDLYEGATMERMGQHFSQLLDSVLTDPEAPVSSLRMLSDQEEETLLVSFNDTQVAYPEDKTVVDLFEEQVAGCPENAALVFRDEALTYKQLNQRVNQLAHYLQEQGIGPEDIVAICIERSLEMVIAILGIIKAGAAYVPIDPEYPQSRIDFILEDTQSVRLLTSAAVEDNLTLATRLPITRLDTDWNQVVGYSTGNPDRRATPENLAYVIYTSGSTGKPKGVLVEHGGVSNLILAQRQLFEVSADSRVIQFAAISFDICASEIFMSLISGATLLLPNDSERSTDVLVDYIKRNAVSHATLPPALLPYITALNSLKTLIFVGEAPDEVLFMALDKQLSVFNAYGPTETTVYSTAWPRQIDYQGAPPIGRPLPNTRIYLLDADGHPVPFGVIGEIYIGGDGVARGYLNREELTRERFLLDPFREQDSLGRPARMYKTGDLARWLSDGNLEFLGRKDNQVKVRGYRIELGEIEAVLRQVEKVHQAVVLTRPDATGTLQLVGYVVAGEGLDAPTLQAYLKAQLPAYMVPGVYVFLDTLPLTSHRKVDRNALPDPDLGQQTTAYIAPRTTTEVALAACWQAALGVERVGIHDNFFSLGGHSLLAARVIAAIRKAFNLEVRVRAIFEAPTIAELAGVLEKSTASQFPALEPAGEGEQAVLSFAQQRLWFIDQFEGSLHYHIPLTLRLKGALVVEALESSFRHILTRHLPLRTTIAEKDGLTRSTFLEAEDWSLHYAAVGEGSPEFISQTSAILTTPFDLSSDFMLRAAVFKVAEELHLLVINVHHIAADGWSLPILADELSKCYTAYSENRTVRLPELKVSYADYAVWQHKHLEGDLLDKQFQYWQGQLQDSTPLELPTDHVRPPVQSTRGALHTFSLSSGQATGLKHLVEQQGGSLYMGLLSVLDVLLYRYTGQSDISVGSPIANRYLEETNGLIGMFVNTLVMRNRVQGTDSFVTLFDQVKNNSLEAYAHQQYPF